MNAGCTVAVSISVPGEFEYIVKEQESGDEVLRDVRKGIELVIESNHSGEWKEANEIVWTVVDVDFLLGMQLNLLALLAVIFRTISYLDRSIRVQKAIRPPPPTLHDVVHDIVPASATKPLPTHIALNISASSAVSMQNLSQWAVWVAASGATYVSINSPHERQRDLDLFIKDFSTFAEAVGLQIIGRKDRTELVTTLTLTKPAAALEDHVLEDGHSIDSGFEGTASPEENNSEAGSESCSQQPSNNNKETFTFTIRFIDSTRDGKSDIVRVARILAESALESQKETGKRNLVSEGVDIKLLDEMLASSEYPEPELMYVFGGKQDVLMLESYPPWEIRLTEIGFIEIGTFARTFTSKWSMLDYYEFIGVSDNEPIRRLLAKENTDKLSKHNPWTPKIAQYKDRGLRYYGYQAVRLGITFVALVWAHAYLEKYPYNRDTRKLKFLMPWDVEGVLENLAFGVQLFCTMDILYTLGTLMIVNSVGAPYTPIMDRPYFSTSLRDFWSNRFGNQISTSNTSYPKNPHHRWNQPIKITIHRISFAPTLKLLKKLDPRKEAHQTHFAIATLVAFGMSCLLHEYAIVMLLPYEWIPGENSVFFLSHGIACVAVERFKRMTGFSLSGAGIFGSVVGWIGTVLFFLVTSPFFVGPHGRAGWFMGFPIPQEFKEFFKVMM
ncbi:UNVERIFIED_CONTAM: hypothetical protein HDU68_000909 [Siphonaria sp. JEL0065]|nr:hypothetical protein HDU68_000909 [Siphonaria sp. JEL0065]